MENYLNWEEVETLHGQGHDIGIHTLSHVNLAEKSNEDTEYEIAESKECLLDHGINVSSFAYPFNEGTEDENIIKTVAKYYDLARGGGHPITFLTCKVSKEESDQPGCRTYFRDGKKFTVVNRYSVMGWNHEKEAVENSYDDQEMLEKFIEVVNSKSKYNNGDNRKINETINAIPVIVYHNIGIADERYSPSTNLFEAEMRYLSENQYKMITFAEIGYDQQIKSSR